MVKFETLKIEKEEKIGTQKNKIEDEILFVLHGCSTSRIRQSAGLYLSRVHIRRFCKG